MKTPDPFAAPAPSGELMSWADLLAFDVKHDPNCYFGNRYLGRGDGWLTVAPSGVGKSVLGFQISAAAALGRPIFTMRTHAPLRSLYIQAEDAFGDVAEEAQGFVMGFKPTKTELSQLAERMRIVRWNHVAGESFLARLRAEYEDWPFDFVTINPLLSFAGCNVSDQEQMSHFLRNGLNPILTETKSLAHIIHHTGKPAKDQGDSSDRSDDELNYSGLGSSELTNWARAILHLHGVRAAGSGVYKLRFGKRGQRAGIVDDNGDPARHLYIEHSKQGLCWLQSDWRPDLGEGGKFQKRFDMAAARAMYNPDLPWSQNEAAIAAQQQMTGRAVRHYKKDLETVY